MPKSNIVDGLPEPRFLKEIRRDQCHQNIIYFMNYNDLEVLELIKQHVDSAISKLKEDL